MRALLLCLIVSSILTLGVFSDNHGGSKSSEKKSVDDYLNKCLSLIPEYSNEKPKEEKTLECPQYRDKSCCKSGATLNFEGDETWMDIIDYNPCRTKTGKPKLSTTCHDRIFDELCFFLCSPDTGPWNDKNTHDLVDDRLRNVPICQSVCDEWFDACKDEYTCTDNWQTGFNSTGNGLQRCMNDANCTTYQETWGGATAYCEGIWDNAFKVVPDSEPCMKFAENQTSGNADVAERYAKELVGSASSPWQRVVPPCVAMAALIALVIT